MNNHETTRRKLRLKELVDKNEGMAPLGRLLGYKDGALIWQMLNGVRPITEKFIAKVHETPGLHGWFDTQSPAPALIDLDNNPEYPAVRRVNIKASAGLGGYAVEYDSADDGPPIVFRADWFKTHGYRPDRLLALRVAGQSMEPSLYDGDLIVVNTAQTQPQDGRAFAVLYEGAATVKRLVRDAGAWWLDSDNADKRAYPRKACTDDTTIIVGMVVYKQSERV